MTGIQKEVKVIFFIFSAALIMPKEPLLKHFWIEEQNWHVFICCCIGLFFLTILVL